MDILINHLGYEQDGPKKAVVKLTAGEVEERGPLKVTIAHAEEPSRVIMECFAEFSGRVHNWKNWIFYTIDFSSLDKPGHYRLTVCADRPDGAWDNPNRPKTKECVSEPFRIGRGVIIQKTLPGIIKYLRSQRCGGDYDAADRSIPFYGERGDRVDVHGGWYDASGDVSKYFSHLSYALYFNPQQSPLVVWSLLKSYTHISGNSAPSGCNVIGKNLRQRMLEEARYGADFLCRMQDGEGWFYSSVFDNWSKDPSKRFICAFRGMEGIKDENYRSGFRKGGGMAIAALARLYSLKDDPLFSESEYEGEAEFSKYLEAAETGFQYLKEFNKVCNEDGKENIIDDYCALLAASELWKTTEKSTYLHAARERSRALALKLRGDEHYRGWFSSDSSGDRPFFHASDAGLPIIALLTYADYETDPAFASDAVNTAITHLEFILAITGEVKNPFGYPRQYVRPLGGEKKGAFFMPHRNETGYWWQGENARIASISAAAKMAAALSSTGQELRNKLNKLAADSIDWILGLNPFDVCMLHGFGRNNPEYEEDFPNAYGGICNGITSGFEDEADIDFLPPAISGQGDHRWRWSEQWLPHAVWYLYAIVLIS